MLKFIPGAKILIWKSTGKLGFHDNKRATPYAIETLGKFMGKYLKRKKVKFIIITLTRRPTKKIRSALKGFYKANLNILRNLL